MRKGMRLPSKDIGEGKHSIGVKRNLEREGEAFSAHTPLLRCNRVVTIWTPARGWRQHGGHNWLIALASPTGFEPVLSVLKGPRSGHACRALSVEPPARERQPERSHGGPLGLGRLPRRRPIRPSVAIA